MMVDGFQTVADAVEQARRLLVHHGDQFTARRLYLLEDQLRRGDQTALASIFYEATGGMGSLNDRYLCPENGDKIEQHEIGAVNESLTELVRGIEAKARSVAAERGIQLAR